MSQNVKKPAPPVERQDGQRDYVTGRASNPKQSISHKQAKTQ